MLGYNLHLSQARAVSIWPYRFLVLFWEMKRGQVNQGEPIRVNSHKILNNREKSRPADIKRLSLNKLLKINAICIPHPSMALGYSTVTLSIAFIFWLLDGMSSKLAFSKPWTSSDSEPGDWTQSWSWWTLLRIGGLQLSGWMKLVFKIFVSKKLISLKWYYPYF